MLYDGLAFYKVNLRFALTNTRGSWTTKYKVPFSTLKTNCRSTSRPPPPSRVPFSPALSDLASVEFTTDKINEVNGTKARLSDYLKTDGLLEYTDKGSLLADRLITG